MLRQAQEDKRIETVLERLDGGHFMNAASEELSALVEEVKRRRKRGKITLTITVEPVDDLKVEFVPSLKAAAPERNFTSTVLFIGESGEYLARDPRQPVLPNLQLREGGA